MQDLDLFGAASAAAPADCGSSHCAKSMLNRPPMPSCISPRRLTSEENRSTGPGQLPPLSLRTRSSSASIRASISSLTSFRAVILVFLDPTCLSVVEHELG